METWFVPGHMKQLANMSTKIFGIDQQGIVTYDFDHLGFRTGNTSGQANLCLIGNTISFGLGIHYIHTFGSLVASDLNLKLKNLSFGCYLHENHDHIVNIKNSIIQNNDDVFLIQINNLDRKRVSANLVVSGNDASYCVKKFVDYFEQVDDLLKHHKKLYLYWDNVSYDLPKTISDQISVLNKCHIDTSLPVDSNTFGIKSHNLIAKIISSKLKIT